MYFKLLPIHTNVHIDAHILNHFFEILKLDKVFFVHNLLTLLFLHVIPKFVQTHLKQCILYKLV